MKVLGVDYGKKRIGIAVSDEMGMIAFPRQIIVAPSRALAIGEIVRLIDKEKIEEVVIGIPRTGDVRKDIKEFTKALEKNTKCRVTVIDESLTSFEAFKESHNMKQERGRNIKTDKKPKDDIAAALILQRYLDSSKLKAQS